ncbi:MAG: CARDB domain-containing protein [Solirubrobacteraceae bacterium]
MRRALPVLPLVLVLALAAPAGAQSSAVVPLRASLISCSAASRTAVFAGSMPAIAGTRVMAMRFDLQSRPDAGATWAPVRVPGLGIYKRSSSGQTGFVFTQRVQALAAPGVYRAVVRFRWYGRGGHVLRVARRTTGTCTQPDPRPDLRPGLLTATLLPDGQTARYALAVINAGRSDAGGFAVDVAGMRAQVPGLSAGEQTTVTVDAPRCAPGTTVAVRVDPAMQVDEADEADDAVQRACPLS